MPSHLALLSLCLAAPLVSQAAVQARLDRSSVAPGESVTLTIQSDHASGAQPDLAPLGTDFLVVGTGQQRSINIVNFQRRDSITWQVRLQPRHDGTLNIPPLTVDGEQTAALTLKVAPPSPAETAEAAQHAFLEVEAGATPGQAVMLQQQIPYTVRLFYDDSIQNGEITAPKLEHATVQQLGEDQKYTVTRHGRPYQVIERHYAIEPERSGKLQIPPASFHGTMLVLPEAGSQDDAEALARSVGAANPSLFADMLRNTPFANDPMFKRAFGGGLPGMVADTRPVAAQGPSIEVKVEPRPPGAATGNWLPAEQIALHDSWQDQPPQFRAGEPVTRTITVQAKGLVASQIPPLALPAPAHARLYTEAPENDSRTDGQTVYGISKQTVTYIPDAAGRLEVPAVTLDWWNTQTHAQSHSELPAQSFSVAPGVAGAQAAAAPQAATPAATPDATAATLPAPASSPGAPFDPWQMLRAWGPWAAAGIGLLVLAAIARWIWKRRGPATRQERAPTPKAALHALRDACRANDAQAAAQALLSLARAQWPADPPRGLAALAARLDRGAAEIRALDRVLYGSDGRAAWQGAALWKALAGGLQARRAEPALDDTGLDALYR